MKALNVFLIVHFILSAALQYNDPDPYLWIPIYLYGAFVCLRALQRKLEPVLYYLGWLAFGSYAVYLLVDSDGVISWWRDHDAENIAQSMKATRPWIEETREFFGLLILLAALTVNWFWLRRTARHTNAESTAA